MGWARIVTLCLVVYACLVIIWFIWQLWKDEKEMRKKK